MDFIRQSCQSLLDLETAARHPGKMERPNYHHGNLQESAVALVLDYLAANASPIPSLREIAKQLGVNHRALYRHFADRNVLIATVAADGFERLHKKMSTAVALDKSGRPSRQLMAAYIDFTLENPRLYDLMFGLPLDALHTAATLRQQVQSVIVLAADAFRQSQDGKGISHTLRDRVIAAWAMTHGLVDLYNRGALRAKDASMAKNYILDQLRRYGHV